MHLRPSFNGRLVAEPDGTRLLVGSGSQLKADGNGLLSSGAERCFCDALLIVGLDARIVQHRIAWDGLTAGVDGDHGQVASEFARVGFQLAGRALVSLRQISQSLGLLVLMVACQLLGGLVGEHGRARAHHEHERHRRQ